MGFWELLVILLPLWVIVSKLDDILKELKKK